MSEESLDAKFSNYGIYEIKEDIEIFLPGTVIKIERIGDESFSYFRRDSEENVIEKIIPKKSNDIKIEIAPIRPLNHPARRTGHVFLKFDKEIYLSQGSAASIFVHCPIEIGIFLIHDKGRESLDWVTCNPLNSRFGLSGPPDTGILCKYAEVSLATDYSDSIPYIEGVMKIVIENSLSSGQNINKVIFPITDNFLYYDDSKAVIDGVKIVLKKRAAVSIADIKTDTLNTDWKKSPTWEETTVTDSMEMGLE